jgi:hypothetical protein
MPVKRQFKKDFIFCGVNKQTWQVFLTPAKVFLCPLPHFDYAQCDKGALSVSEDKHSMTEVAFSVTTAPLSVTWASLNDIKEKTPLTVTANCHPERSRMASTKPLTNYINFSS